MGVEFNYSVFKKVLFPKIEELKTNTDFLLKKIISFKLDETKKLEDLSFSIFDFETTGLKTGKDKIIEIGVVKITLGSSGSKDESFETLIDPKIPFSKTNISSSITGISEDMLQGQPTIEEILPKFLDFISGSVLIAHNAEFDFAFLKAACLDCGYELVSWPCYCTLKMARVLHPELESKSLDHLANLYGLSFDARHRSLGDVLVTKDVMLNFFKEAGFLTLADLSNFKVV